MARSLSLLIAVALTLMPRASVRAQDSWDLEKCRTAAASGHVCTPEHLATDLALLTARAIVHFLDPEFQAHELVHRRDPQTHLSDPEAVAGGESSTNPGVKVR